MRKISHLGKNTGGPFAKSFISMDSDDRIAGEVISYKVSPKKAMEMVDKAHQKNNIVLDLNKQISRYKKTLK